MTSFEYCQVGCQVWNRGGKNEAEGVVEQNFHFAVWSVEVITSLVNAHSRAPIASSIIQQEYQETDIRHS